jgi:hypothetical protein
MVWLGPALAIGGISVFVVIRRVVGALLNDPSFTINCAIYVPTTSAVKIGFTAVALLSIAALPAGTESKLQWYVSKPPAISVEAAPLNCTREPTVTT